MTTNAPAAGDTAAREYWSAVLRAGGTTTIPRWTRQPVPGVAEHMVPIPDDVLAALVAAAVPAGAATLAAHAAVLAALTGEREVATGYLTAHRTLPCRLSTGAGSWRALLQQARRAEAELLAHSDFPVAELQRELRVGPVTDTEFVLDDVDTDLAAETVLRVQVVSASRRPALRLRYRLHAFDAAAAARIAGYHLTALAQLVTDPDADPGQADLLSEPERRFQLDGLAGPERELPDRRFHELFEERVRRHPDAVAAVLGEQHWTYRELNARANRLARALLARGLGREGVVAVATERTLDWTAAVIAIFKAGGVYLPIEPHLPARRIADTLARAECALVLTEPGSTANVDPALALRPGPTKVLFVDAYAEDHAADDLGIPVGPDQLAYIYFTSGSTGEPKGAMCEHAGMLNHLQAKIADLGVAEGDVVAQTAPQCFDISLWQLISALLVGGRTHVVPQEVILDVARFVDTVVTGRVGVLQVVPSYLEVVLSYLDQHPRSLPDLHCVSVTGEALKIELARRWFAAQPAITLVNAYGLTETSDDTNHEVMVAAPVGDRVPLGPAVQNVRVYVVDPQLRPVPLGAPGEIAFSGVCVGRGYINDPERTAAAYRGDPHRPGQRLYRAGDFGRWRPDGKLEFLGRRDSQVKISGFRIEIGEIENALLGAPGVRDGAVVVAERGGGARLVAFYTGPAPVEVDELRERVGHSLPAYMVPAAFHWQPQLPLTANGKIDKKALTALAAELDEIDAAEDAPEPPATPTEQRLAAAWAGVLHVTPDRIGRRDHFFDRGGTSLLAVKVAIALKREVSLKDITRHPVLADLAALIDGRIERPAELLQTLADGDGRSPALICFPYAGGNAVNFRPLAAALSGSGIAVHAVELPGHDLVGDDRCAAGPGRGDQAGAFAPLADVVEQVVAEIGRRGLTRVLLWGHSSGTAFAAAAARRLVDRGVDVRRVFLAAQLPGDPDARSAAAAELAGRSAAEIVVELRSDRGYTGLGELDERRAEHVGAAYRHDAVAAHRWFADAGADPAVARLPVPVTAVVAADDPSTAGYAERHREWSRLAERVELHELADGGHYFLRTRPDEAARIVRQAAGLLAS
jgi:amino acid adenylation domain-containing protein